MLPKCFQLWQTQQSHELHIDTQHNAKLTIAAISVHLFEFRSVGDEKDYLSLQWVGEDFVRVCL
jgi:hypothetical protein